MLYLAWVLSLIGAVLAGFHYRRLWDTVKKISSHLAAQTKQEEAHAPRSTVIDPEDEIQAIQMEHKRRMKLLNPTYDDDL